MDWRLVPCVDESFALDLRARLLALLAASKSVQNLQWWDLANITNPDRVQDHSAICSSKLQTLVEAVLLIQVAEPNDAIVLEGTSFVDRDKLAGTNGTVDLRMLTARDL